MRTSTIYKGLIAAAVLAGAGMAQAAHVPSPCATGEQGSGTNCMYLVAEGVTNNYDALDGNRDATTGTTMDIAVWMDMGQTAVQGGGFDLVFDTANVITMSWAWSADFTAGEQTLDGTASATGYDGIQFDDFAGNGYGGTTGTQSGFAQVGTLTVTVDAATALLFSIAQPYADNTFPNCFAPGAGSGAPAQCVATDFYNLEVSAVPVPAAAWLMMGGLGALFGMRRKQAV